MACCNPAVSQWPTPQELFSRSSNTQPPASFQQAATSAALNSCSKSAAELAAGMVMKEESFYPSWFLQGWCQQSSHTCRDLSEISIMHLLCLIQPILFICDVFLLRPMVPCHLNAVWDATHLLAFLRVSEQQPLMW